MATQEELDRKRALAARRQQNLTTGFTTKVDMRAAIQGSAVDAKDLQAEVSRSQEEELAKIMRKAAEERDRAERAAQSRD